MVWHLNHARYGRTPWAVQTEAMRRAKNKTRFGHFLEQGLGKTSLTLNEFVNSEDVDICVVIAPQSFKYDWTLQPAEWGVSFIPVGMWPDDLPPFDAEMALYAINYEAVRSVRKSPSRAYLQIERLLNTRRCMLVIDESKTIANPESLTTKSVIELAKRAVMVRELNGTPMTESVVDYYPQLRALGELNGMKPKIFRNRYAKMGGYFSRQVVGINEDRQEELARILDRCTFRALKKDWRKDLPPQITVPVHLEMTERQDVHYHTMMEEFYATIEDEDITAQMVLTQMQKLQQISGCMLMKDGKLFWIEKPENNPKVNGVLDIIEGGPGKVIVVHLYKHSGAMLLEALAKYRPARIQGGMKPQEVSREKERFNDDADCRVIVLQEVAGARGHTLLGQRGKDRCNRIIFYENHPGLYWREQIKDRNHRGEQDETCLLYDLIVSPMDQLWVDTLINKKNLADVMDDVIRMVRTAHLGAKVPT